jgi:hypothetical protein
MPRFLKNKPDIIERLSNAVCRLKQEYSAGDSAVNLSDLNNGVVFVQDDSVKTSNDCITKELPAIEKIYNNYNSVYAFVDLTAEPDHVAEPQYLHDIVADTVPVQPRHTTLNLQVLIVISIAVLIGMSIIGIGMTAYFIKNKRNYVDIYKTEKIESATQFSKEDSQPIENNIITNDKDNLLSK